MLEEGDTIQFVYDHYSYDGVYDDSYFYYDPIVYTGELTVSDMYMAEPENAIATYRLTDIYGQTYWTETF